MSDQATVAASATERCADTSSFQQADPLPASSGLYKDPAANELAKDHFVERDGIRFAGSHLIVDLWCDTPLDDLQLMESTLRAAVDKAEATLLHIHLHHFTPHGGISGVAVLAESHISVHTWPECGYAAFDVFMCGDAKPEAAVAAIREAFSPTRCTVAEHLRGRTK